MSSCAGRVGKTSILKRLVYGTFDEKEVSTKGMPTSYVEVSYGETKMCLWDTAGQEKYHALGPMYYRDAQGIVVVYNVTSIVSFERAKTWIEEVTHYHSNSSSSSASRGQLAILLLGNKFDLAASSTSTTGTPAIKLANEYIQTSNMNAIHMTVSAKTGQNITSSFQELNNQLIQLDKTSSVSKMERDGLIILSPDDENNQNQINDNTCTKYYSNCCS